MKLIIEPKNNEWPNICKRADSIDDVSIEKIVIDIIENVAKKGDEYVLQLTQQFDAVYTNKLTVDEEEWKLADEVSPSLQNAIDTAIDNITKFHLAQKQSIEIIETTEQLYCYRKSVGIENVGLYIPGGSAPLFSTFLMLAIPAKIAGCKNIIVCTPPQQNGKIDKTVLYCARKLGINTLYKCGGAQAIAAMYFGTQTILKCSKIFGPGNRYVTLAKQILSAKGLSIDMPAGPSEVLVYADETSNAAYVAADLLSQAEHGADSEVILLVKTSSLAKKILEQVQQQLNNLPRAEIAKKAIENSRAVVLSNTNEAIDFINEYAPEHLILACAQADLVADKIINAGSVFIGNYTPESLGDYASGTNHTLPTHGYAKAYSGVSLDSFVKKITFQKANEYSLSIIGPSVIEMANAEGLTAHANAVSIRLHDINKIETTHILDNKVRDSIKKLKPYSSARHEFDGMASIMLDANENSLGSPTNVAYNRYPDAFQKELKEKLSKIKNINTENIFIGNGSDEIIDLAIRIFCEPNRDQIIISSPTYGMYKVSAEINNVEIIDVPLTTDFKLNVAEIKKNFTNRTKILFICSPNNPTGALLNNDDITDLVSGFKGLVIIDEAYIDFAQQESWLKKIEVYNNLLVLQTLSKAWGLAGLRLGIAYANTELLNWFNKIKPPYNISTANQSVALQALNNEEWKNEAVQQILSEREILIDYLQKNKWVKQVYKTDSNFILFKVFDANLIYHKLKEKQIVVRNRTNDYNCHNCLRITVGTKVENKKFIEAFNSINI